MACKSFRILNSIRFSTYNPLGCVTVRYVRGNNSRDVMKIIPKIQPKKNINRNTDINEDDFINQLAEDHLHSEFMEDEITSQHTNSKTMHLKDAKERQERKDRQKLKLQILQRKYFKLPKEHNLLTWKAKEQIHHLHKSDTSQWSIGILSQIFPVSEYGIKQIVRSNFYGMSKTAIRKHDERVFKIWEDLSIAQAEDGELDKHIDKIMKANGDKDLPFPAEKKPIKLFDHENGPTPFSDILRKFPKYKMLEASSPDHRPDDNVGHNKDDIANQLLKTYFFKTDDSKPNLKKTKSKYAHNQGQNRDFTQEDDMGIEIPQNMKQKDKAYQKDNVIYDENGDFLYRVPS